MPWFEQYKDVPGDTSTGAFLESGGIVYGSISTSTDTDWYRMDCQQGVKYTVLITALTAGLNASLVLRDSSGKVLYTVKVGSDGKAGIDFTPQTGGKYFWDVEGAGTVGDYTVTAFNNVINDYPARESTPSVLNIGQSVSGTIETWSDANWHKVNLVAGHTYVFSNTGGSLSDAYLMLFPNERSGALAYSGKGSLVYTPTTSGTYYLDVSSGSFEGIGSYHIQAIETPVIQVKNQSVYRTTGNNQNMVFTLTLSMEVPYAVTVDVGTYGETAKAGLDYQPIQKQTITFAANTTTATVSVPILPRNEPLLPALAFELNLSNPVGAVIQPNYRDPSGTYIGTLQPDAWGAIWSPIYAPGATGGYFPSNDLFPYQWYLFTTRTVNAWSHATGKGIRVAVFDQGIDVTNPDLTANVASAAGVNASTLTMGGAPVLSGDNHGTAVAGVIAAARDSKGVVGVAYNAQLVPIYSPLAMTPQHYIDIKNAFTYAKNFDILNNSWGFGNKLLYGTNWAFFDDMHDPRFAPAFDALQDLVTNGRNGLGTIVVQSAGNSFSVGDDTNLHNFQNSRYIITVGATDYQGNSSSFSTTGASILVSAPGGAGNSNFSSILTTDRTGAAGYNFGDHAFLDGTSFSAPIVSGIVSLMLEANPHLGYRDVQQILAYTAHQVSSGSYNWSSNGAHDWNGGGLRFDSVEQSTGFGQVDALAAVRLAAKWNLSTHTVANTYEVTGSQTVQAAIPDNDKKGIYSTIHISSDLVAERVDVSLNVTHPFIGDLEVTLFSPTGTASYLMYRPAKGSLSAVGSSQSNIHFTFDTVLDMGEAATGDWTLNVRDLAANNTGTFDSWSIDIVGHKASADHTFFYTNEFPDLVKADATRGTLSDPNGGIDTINESALGSDDRIDLSGATASTINGGILNIAKGTTIQNVYAGDGNDTLIANPVGSVLVAGGGNDTMLGGAGNDTFVVGTGNATIDGGGGVNTVTINATRANCQMSTSGDTITIKNSGALGATDTLKNIQRINFSDVAVALDTGGIAGEVYRVYQAAFGRKPDLAGLGYWIASMDKGSSLNSVASSFVQSKEFQSLYGSNPDANTLITAMYTNVLHRAPDQAGFDYWKSELSSGHITAGGMLASFSESTENQVQVIASIKNGIDYLLYAG